MHCIDHNNSALDLVLDRMVPDFAAERLVGAVAANVDYIDHKMEDLAEVMVMRAAEAQEVQKAYETSERI